MALKNKMKRLDIEALMVKLPQLTLIQTNILAIAAVAGMHLNQTSALLLAARLGVKGEGERLINVEQFKIVVLYLSRQGFVEDQTKGGVQCKDVLVEPLCSYFRQKNPLLFKKIIETFRHEMPAYPPLRGYYQPIDLQNGWRDVRFCLYENNYDLFTKVAADLVKMYNTPFNLGDFVDDFFAFGTDSLNWSLLDEVPIDVALMGLTQGFMQRLWNAENVNELETYTLDKFPKAKEEQRKGLIEILKLAALFKGNKTLYKAHNDAYSDQNAADALNGKAVLQFWGDNTEGSLSDLELRIKKTRSETGYKKAFVDGNAGLFAIAALLKSGKPDYMARVFTYISLINQTHPHFKSYRYLLATHHFLQNRKREAMELLLNHQPTQSIERVVYGCAIIWCEMKVDPTTWRTYEGYFDKAKKAGFEWLAMEFAAILSKGYEGVDEAKSLTYLAIWEDLEQRLGTKSLMHSVAKYESWQLSLQALSTIAAIGKNTEGGKNKTQADSRVVYMINPNPVIIQPKEQTLNKNGAWSAGRNIALKRFKAKEVPNMTPQDNKIGSTVTIYSTGYWGGETAEFDLDKTLPLLVGHPYLFLMDNPSVSFELTERKPELIVESKGSNYEISFPHTISSKGINLIKETPTRYAVMRIEQKHVDIINALGGKALRVPKAAEKQLAEIVGRLSSVITVQSTLLEDNTDIEKIKGDAQIHVHLLPVNDGMKVEFYTKPFTHTPPFVKPAKGSTNLIAEIDGKRKVAIRDLKLEKKNATDLENALNVLGKFEGAEYEWLVETPDDALEVLLELRTFAAATPQSPEKTDEKPSAKTKKAKKGENTEGSLSENLTETGLPKIIIEWPKGERFKILKQLGFDNMSLRISRKNDWFTLEGEVKVSEDRVLSMKTLLELMATGKSNGQFIELGEGQFLALTKQLSKKLKALSDYADPQKDGSLRFHPLAAGAIDDFANEFAQVETDKHWKTHLKTLKNLSNIHAELPSTFNAELRPYQLEGYQWLMRLADWGVGACLADDMGLGKTVQALAMLTARAEKGAALVLAPVSVCRNWEREARRFAPTLNPIIFRDGDRAEMVKNLQPFDVLICTYDLMQREAEILRGVQFSTIILDEAQAIKNHTTKRTKAAMELQGDFRVITTGTPVENHLGELWSLYNFINPGLLGSIGHFQERFAVPIDKNGDREKKGHLKKLIQPFILRRRKNDVLDDLPPKTEITLSVTLSEGERAFYETLRRNAIASLESLQDDGEGTKQLKILAELMRLRRACCNPNLVNPELGLKSSKLELFGEVVEELLDNGHKALVFSQFVGHLGLIKEWVESKNIKYQYLDGSTTPQKREDAIAAFQSGRGGDLFLISLKAGGTGLNLTAADYVIHTDPWWNPAVEDQASDRAHRIGQTRPVTIYRLITEQTIEEKILQLHAHKRDLADSLLEGTDASAKLTSADLLALMKQE